MLFLVAKTQTFIIVIITDSIIIMKGAATSTTGRAFGYCSTQSKYMQNRCDLLGQDFDGDECLGVSWYFLLLRRRKPRATEPPLMPAPAPAWGRESSSLNGHAAAGCTSPLCPAARKAEAPPSCFNIFPRPSLVKKQHVSAVDQHAGPPRDTAATR